MISRQTVEEGGSWLDEDEPLNVNERGKELQRRSRQSVDPEHKVKKLSTRASNKSKCSSDTFNVDESDLANEVSQWMGLDFFEEEAPSSPRGAARFK